MGIYSDQQKYSSQVLWIWGDKIAFCLQQAGKHNFSSSHSRNLGSTFLAIPVLTTMLKYYFQSQYISARRKKLMKFGKRHFCMVQLLHASDSTRTLQYDLSAHGLGYVDISSDSYGVIMRRNWWQYYLVRDQMGHPVVGKWETIHSSV